MTDRLWMLGAADPEMEAIEALLLECGERVTYATADGHRVTGGTAYRADPVPGATHWVECESPGQAREVIIDHHRPGDPGYGRPPAEFLLASSIGQVIAALIDAGVSFPRGVGRGLAMEITVPGWRFDGEWMYEGAGARIYLRLDRLFTAAADHCLGAAYRGECPGVDPDELMRWRVETRAAFQGRATAEVLADVERAREALRAAPLEVVLAECPDCGTTALRSGADGSCAVSACQSGGNGWPGQIAIAQYRDLRGQHVAELPEAAAREGLCFLSDVTDRDGRSKIVCQSGSPEQIRAFLDHWAPDHGLTDTYGDPARGFAGGYLP
jgi:hypothetical protein